jgi:hypothetical protein
LRTSGIVPLKEEAVYDKPEKIGRDEENCPAQNKTFHIYPPRTFTAAALNDLAHGIP